MTEQLPEGKQYEMLLKKLAGNQAFARLRQRGEKTQGNANLGPLRFVELSENPSDFCRHLDGYHADWRIVGNLMAKLKRDGHLYALQTLTASLTRGIPLPGEKEPITDLKHFTFVMMEAKKTLLLLRFVEYTHCCDWDAEYAPDVFTSVPCFMTEKSESSFAGRRFRMDREMLVRHSLGSLFKRENDFSKIQSAGFCGDPGRYHCLCEGFHNPYAGESHKDFVLCDFLLKFSGQPNESMKYFSRKEQENMACWSVAIPTYHWKYILNNRNVWQNTPRSNHLELVLYPENMKKFKPSNGHLSNNISNGYGLWFGLARDWFLEEHAPGIPSSFAGPGELNYNSGGVLVLRAFYDELNK